MTEDDEPFEPFEPFEPQVHMEDCTCEHAPEQHTWGHCEVEDCPCLGGWTE